MKCEQCDKQTWVVFITREHSKICPECKQKEMKNERLSINR